ncbi:G/T mismatch-specific thymine DNA glycosylase [Bagarius yarrelli]|uniref:G/T mismatch-specific thymine DNA glycosylase n=1 Tax=Bagarius yarrelli TaxID=175774 RepID=A0A556V0N7_BAGYA|nr:G/T mismatch-specific thymine DNA glycosylase [Bagarius yarrelli]
MEEQQVESQMQPVNSYQHWYPPTYQHFQPVPQYHQMAPAFYSQQDVREYSVMSDFTQEFTEHHREPAQSSQLHQLPVPPPALPTTPGKGKKRGRPPKQEKNEQTDAEITVKKAKRTLDRFNGMSVEEVMAKKLPDVIAYNLDILIVGINPGLMSAFKGRHYPNPGNHFWKCLFLSGLTDEQLNYMHDQTLPDRYGIGFTNMVERTTPGSKDLSNKEIREGGKQLLEKLQKYKPRIAAFNGKCIYETFCKEIFGVKAKNLEFGLQPYKVPETETVCYLMPSSSPRCAQFPRAQDKVHFYIKLKELRDQLKGVIPTQDIQETQYTFDLAMAKEDAKKMAIKEEQHDPGYEGSSSSATQQTCSFYPSNKQDAELSEHSAAMGQVGSNQWTMQPFADQIPDIRVQSAQQHLQALHAQYSHMANGNGAHFMEGHGEEPGMMEMPVQEPPAAALEPGNSQQAPTKGKRGRPASKQPKAKPGPKPKKAKAEKEGQPAEGAQEKIDESFKKVKRKVDRFKGMSEEEVMKRTLPDILTANLDYVICLFLSGFTEQLLNHMHDQSLPEKYGIGFTNMVARATPGSKDLSSKELREGGKILVEKIKQFKPLIAVFNGKCIYEMFCREIFGKKPKSLEFGLQPLKIPDSDTALYLMPSSSARCAQFPRAQDKVHFYIKLRELRDQLKGVARPRDIEEVNYSFDLGMAKEDAKRMAIKEENYDPGYEAAYGGAYGEPGSEQPNGHCAFASGEAEAADKAPRNADGQWMTNSFADQIPEIGSSSQAQTEAV